MSRLSGWLREVSAYVATQRNNFLELAEFVSRKKESNLLSQRLFSSGLFLAFDRAFSNVFDYILYPMVMYYSCLILKTTIGFIIGGALMTALSFLVCWLWIFLYDRFGVNLLILEDLKNLREYDGKEKKKKFFASVLKRGDLIAFFIVNIKYDPFYAFVYKRKGNNRKGIKGRSDWVVFSSAVLISNVIWWVPSYFIGFIGFSSLELFQNYVESVKPLLIQIFSCFLATYFSWEYLVFKNQKKIKI